MKKIFILFIIFLLTFLFFGCENINYISPTITSNVETKTPSSTPFTLTTVKIELFADYKGEYPIRIITTPKVQKIKNKLDALEYVETFNEEEPLYMLTFNKEEIYYITVLSNGSSIVTKFLEDDVYQAIITEDINEEIMEFIKNGK